MFLFPGRREARMAWVRAKAVERLWVTLRMLSEEDAKQEVIRITYLQLMDLLSLFPSEARLRLGGTIKRA